MIQILTPLFDMEKYDWIFFAFYKKMVQHTTSESIHSLLLNRLVTFIKRTTEYITQILKNGRNNQRNSIQRFLGHKGWLDCGGNGRKGLCRFAFWIVCNYRCVE